MPKKHFSQLLPPGKEWFTPIEVAKIIGRTPQYVRNAFDSQRLMGHAMSVPTGRGLRPRKRHQITREALLIFLLETANYTPEDYTYHMERLLDRMHVKYLRQLDERIKKRLKESHY